MQKRIVAFLSVVAILVCLIGCGTANGNEGIPESDYPEIENAVAEMISPILERYGCTYSDISMRVKESEDSEYTHYNVVFTVPELSELSVAEKAHLADQVTDITSVDVEKTVGKEYPMYTVISAKISGDNGELVFVDIDGEVTLLEGDTALIMGEPWTDIDSTYENSEAGEANLSATGDLSYDDFKRYVKILGVETSKPNSAGGVDATVKFKKTDAETEESIKYLSFWVTPYNAVDDVEYSDIGNKSEAKLRVVGPIETNENDSATFECIWYNSVIDHAKIVRVEVEYMDGTVVSCSDSDALN